MKPTLAGVLAIVTVTVVPCAASAQDNGPVTPSAGRVAAVRVHGNHTTPDADVLAIAAVAAGDTITPGIVGQVTRRLEQSGRFRRVDVRTRFASLSDTSAILLVIVVEEQIGIAAGVDMPVPGPLRRLEASTMWLPVLRHEDGYGFIYGARVAFVDLLGPKTRIGVPLTWGGERRASVEIERRFDRGPLTRLIATAGVSRREHPAVGLGDRRTEAAIRAERSIVPWLVVAGSGGVADVRFGEAPETLRALAVEAVLDTRHDPAFPRDAIYVTATVERLWFDAYAGTTRVEVDARGFLGLFGSTVLAVRALHCAAGQPLPVFEQALLGGGASLRGFSLGYRYGDRLAAGSAEIRVPLTSPLKAGRFGVAVFADSGAVYSADESLSHARFDTGVGAGLFFQAPLVSFRADIARGLAASTRGHVSIGVSF